MSKSRYMTDCSLLEKHQWAETTIPTHWQQYADKFNLQICRATCRESSSTRPFLVIDFVAAYCPEKEVDFFKLATSLRTKHFFENKLWWVDLGNLEYLIKFCDDHARIEPITMPNLKSTHFIYQAFFKHSNWDRIVHSELSRKSLLEEISFKPELHPLAESDEEDGENEKVLSEPETPFLLSLDSPSQISPSESEPDSDSDSEFEAKKSAPIPKSTLPTTAATTPKLGSLKKSPGFWVVDPDENIFEGDQEAAVSCLQHRRMLQKK